MRTLAATIALAALCPTASATGGQSPSVEDAIAMTRVQQRVAVDGSVVAFSPDGAKLAAVVWRGDLARNVNVYSLLLFETRDLMGGSAHAVTVHSRAFEGDPLDQTASPITDVTFLADGRTIAFIGREGHKPAQVFAVDLASRQVRQLTDHPTAVRSYVVGPDGRLKAYSALLEDPREAIRDARLAEDGAFISDRDVFPERRHFFTFLIAMPARRRQVRQYFLSNGVTPKLFFDSQQSRLPQPPEPSDPKKPATPTGALDDEGYLRGWARLTGDFQGRRALLLPYALTEHDMHAERYRYYDTTVAHWRRTASPFGVVDLQSGRIERLIDAPHPQFARDGGGPFWSPDGRSVVVHSLLPLDGNDPAADKARAAEPPQWLEVDLATRRMTKLSLPTGWRVVRWDPGLGLVLNRGSEFGRVSRLADGGWGALQELGSAGGFSPFHPLASNGRIVVGVREALLTPPELAAYDLESRRVHAFTDLNPELRRRRFAPVEPLRWAHEHEKNAFAFLIKPVGYEQGRRYPLVILLDDGVLLQEGEPFLLDGTVQLSGHALQMLAGAGFVVLYPRMPSSLRQVMETAKEGAYMRDNALSAIAELDRAGLIDPGRVGLSGWSRAAYYTDSILIHSPFRFAAASHIDGGAAEYNEGSRPFTDEELRRIRTPLLIEAHRPATLVHQAAMADRMDALGKPVEVLYFATASHQATRPRHRMRSLGTHVDWWRFWLQDYEDPDPAKASQYERWRRMKEMAKERGSGS